MRFKHSSFNVHYFLINSFLLFLWNVSTSQFFHWRASCAGASGKIKCGKIFEFDTLLNIRCKQWNKPIFEIKRFSQVMQTIDGYCVSMVFVRYSPSHLTDVTVQRNLSRGDCQYQQKPLINDFPTRHGEFAINFLDRFCSSWFLWWLWFSICDESKMMSSSSMKYLFTLSTSEQRLN